MADLFLAGLAEVAGRCGRRERTHQDGQAFREHGCNPGAHVTMRATLSTSTNPRRVSRVQHWLHVAWLNVNRKSILFVEWWLGYSIEGIEPRLWSCEDN